MDWDGKTERRTENKLIVSKLNTLSKRQEDHNILLNNLNTKLFDEDMGFVNKVKKLDEDINGNGKPGIKADIAEIVSSVKVLTERGSGQWKQLVLTGSLILIFGTSLAWILDRTYFVSKAVAASAVVTDSNNLGIGENNRQIMKAQKMIENK